MEKKIESACDYPPGWPDIRDTPSNKIKPITQTDIVGIWTSRSKEVSHEQRSGMAKIMSALQVATIHRPVLFKCPDGTLLKIDRDRVWYSPEHAQEMMADKFVQGAINKAYENGYNTGKKHQ